MPDQSAQILTYDDHCLLSAKIAFMLEWRSYKLLILFFAMLVKRLIDSFISTGSLIVSGFCHTICLMYNN